MAFKIHYKGIIDTGRERKEVIIIADGRNNAIEALCKIAENMGGDFTDIVSCDITEERLVRRDF